MMDILFELVAFILFSMVNLAKEEDGVEDNLPPPPPGYYFVPSASQIIQSYLVNKILGLRLASSMVKVKKDVENLDPSELNFGEFKYCRTKEGYFITNKVERKTETEGTTVLKTTTGFWKESKDEYCILDGDQIVGYKRSFTYYEGEEPHGVETCWRMKEFSVNPEIIPANHNVHNVRDEIEKNVACKIRYKQPKPPGVPINEDEEE